MEASVSNLNTVLNISSSFIRPHKTNKLRLTECLSFKQRKKLNNQRLCCVKLESSTDNAELERKLEAEMNPDWMMELGKWCEGRGGMVEMMECLEKEAIIGEDEGREATDYHRRAQIFDKSSQVFQALKEHQHSTLDPF